MPAMLNENKFCQTECQWQKSFFFVLYQLIDIGLIALALLISIQLNYFLFEISVAFPYILLVTYAAFLYWSIAHIKHLYTSWRSLSLSAEATEVIEIWMLTIVLILLTFFMFKVTAQYSRRILFVWFILTPALLIFTRVYLHKALATIKIHLKTKKRIAIVGSSEVAHDYANKIKHHSEIIISGIFTDTLQQKEHPNTYIAGYTDLFMQIKHKRVDCVYLAFSFAEYNQLNYLVSQLADTHVPVYFILDDTLFSILHARWERLGSMYALSIYDTPFQGLRGIIKRLEDLCLSTLILSFIAIPMLIIALLVKITSPGPIIFRQTRYGMDGSPITVYKFRTMTVCEQSDNFKQVTKNDPRITPFGAFLRKHSLDELPQFINVIQGHMSIVGPRPHVMKMDDEFRKNIQGYILRYRVKPGITGLAQINGWRGETDTEQQIRKRIECDLDYIKHYSIWLDLKIIAITFIKVFITRDNKGE